MKKLLSSPEKSTAGRSAFLSSVTASVALIICCAILMTGATWAWWTASTAVKTDVIRTANYETIVKVINNKTGEEVTPNDDGSYDLDKNIRYTVTITPDPDTTTASTGFATFSVDDVDFDENGETDTFHTIQIAPGESVWFDIVGYTSLKDIVANWATSSTPDIVPDDPKPVNPVFEGDPRFVKTPVKLVPTDENSTAMIERDGVVETWNNDIARNTYSVNEVIEPITDRYGDYASGNYNAWYLFGLKSQMTKAELDGYVRVQGEGYYKVFNLIGNEVTSNEAIIGTGFRVDVYADADDALVESFYVVIIGDINGDGITDATDTSFVKTEAKNVSWSDDTVPSSYLGYRVKAADIDTNGIIDASDTSFIKDAAKNASEFNQITAQPIS